MNAVCATDVAVERNGRTLLGSVSLEVAAGAMVGIVGPNGAGKSTLLRVLSGDLAPSGGAATLQGVDVAGATLRRLARLRSYVGPQTVSDVVFRAGDVVAMGRHPIEGRVGVPDGADGVAAAMARVDVAHLADREMRTLSSGEQQRVHLARAIAQQSPIMLLDEPTSALDVGHQEMVMTVLQTLAEEGLAVIAVLHDLNLAAAHADRILLLDGGTAAAFGSPAEVLTAARLSTAYRQPMEVICHPFRSCPLVLTTGRREL